MKRTFLALAALAIVLPAWQQTRAADVSVDFFYNNLSGGSWIEVADYGYCWQPDIVVSNTSWRPYADGYWAWTDLGWTWISYEDFGWATYHYGRWARIGGHGWVWVPGRDRDLVWGPAWVSWRTGGDYIGWAPLPPGGVHIGASIGGRVDIDFDIGPGYYNFVPVRYIGEPVLRDRIVDVSQNITYINQTVNVTNITYKNKTVYNYGPDVNVLSQHSSRPIQRLKLERQENVDVSAAAKSGALTKVQGDKLVVAAPAEIKQSAKQIAPPAVKTKVAKADIDKGWSGISDPKAQAELRQKMKTEDPKKIPPPTGAAETGQAAGGASPAGAAASPAAPATTGTSPADLERGKGKGKRGERAAAAPGAEASPAAPETAEFGKGKGKGKRGEKAQPGAAETTESATGAASSAGEASPAETEESRGRGKQKGKRDQDLSAPPSPSGASSGPSEPAPQMGKGKKGKGQLERGEPGAPTQPGDVSSEPRQGKQKGRSLEQTGAPPAPGVPQGEGPEGRGRGKKARAEGVQPSAAQPGPAGGQEQPGKGKKKKGEPEEATPAPSPQ